MAETTGFFQDMNTVISDLVEKRLRYYFVVKDEDLHKVVIYLFKTMGCRLSTATATERYDAIEVLYHFSHDATGTYYCPRILMTNKDKPQMSSITRIVKGAEWIEREMAEMYGIDFKGHPRKEPLLTKDNSQVRVQPLRARRIS
ncbi:MAG: NADH-quinone oxidoreductase subunit C [candidate division KSB1 bacterium]|nr:NADH-quinone oxidoreductase subunit C [candidate division KSB1 bacterium]